jgi:pantoate--beta-alanine ligase
LIERLGCPDEASAWCARERDAGRSLGFVPTMGALHDGHLELVERALDENERALVSVFVNPLQFDDPRDLERYPRDLEADATRLESLGCHMVFSGELEGFFPGQLNADGVLPPERLLDPGPAALGLEGEFRPGHFAGVVTIVDRLFDVTVPTRAYFGAKDFQQCLVVRDLARRRGGPRVVVCDTVREPSGLALSSRNALLDEAGRAAGSFIPRALEQALEAWDGGERRADVLVATMEKVLGSSPLEVEYAEVRDPENWTAERPTQPLERAVALIAAKAGAVRLIDNRVLSC